MKSSEPSKKTEPVKNKEPNQLINNDYTVGKTVLFGNYPQGTNGEVKPIEWVALESDGKTALLLSKHILTMGYYDDPKLSWESCYLRKWINDEFFKKAFTEDERKKISFSSVKPDDLLEKPNETDRETSDRIFILSEKEYMKYKYILENRLEGKVAYLFPDDPTVQEWWFRTVTCQKKLFKKIWLIRLTWDNERLGECAGSVVHGVRPALRINLS